MKSLFPAESHKPYWFAIAAAVALFFPAAGRCAQDERHTDEAETIRRALESQSADRQRAALVLIPGLGLQGRQASAVVKQLADYIRKTSDDERRSLAIRAYGRLAGASAAAPVLKEQLSAPAASVRRAAGMAVVDLATASAKAFDRPGLIVPPSVEAINSAAGTGPAVSWTQAWAPGFLREQNVFSGFTEDCRQLLPVCARALKDDDDSVRASGAEAVRLLARAIADALPDPALATTEARTIDPVEAKLKWVLLRPAFESLNEHAVALGGALGSARAETRHVGVRAAAAVAQARTQALASRTYPPESLLSILGRADEPDALRRAVAALLPPLAERLGDESPDVRLGAAEAFELAGPDGRSQLDAVIRASGNQDVFVRWVAARTLGRMFVGASPDETSRIVSALRVRVADLDLDVRNAALTSLARGGPVARGATDAVLGAVIKGDPDQRILAMRTLQLIEADRVAAVAALAVSLQSDVPRVRKAALTALGAIGTAAKPALGEVRKLLHDPDDEVRREAAQTILAIDREL